MHELETAALMAAEHAAARRSQIADANGHGDYIAGPPPKVWFVGEDATVEFGQGRDLFDGAVLTSWSPR